MSIAVRVYEACREAVRDHPPGHIESVRLAVGELAAVEPDLIAFAWQAVTADTADAAAELEIVWCPAQQHCAVCAEAKSRGDLGWLQLCPDCGSILQVEGGSELDVLELVYVTEED